MSSLANNIENFDLRLDEAVKTVVAQFRTIAREETKRDNDLTPKQEPIIEINSGIINKFLEKPVITYSSAFVTLRKSEGVVLSINEANGTFLTNSEEIGVSPATLEQSEFLIDEVSDEEKSLLKPGAVFYWHIGYLDQPSGRTRVSQLRFRRMPIWTKKDFKEVEQFKSRFASIIR